MSFWKSTICLLTSGIFSAGETPAATSSSLTLSTASPTSRVTVPPSTPTAPRPLPVSACTTALWAARLATVHTFSNRSLSTNLVATLETTWSAAESSCGPSALTALPTRGGSPWDSSHFARSAVTWEPSTRTSAALVMRFTAASSIAGLEASGSTVETYRSVSSTMSCTQTVSSEIGTKMQVSVISTADTALFAIRPPRDPPPWAAGGRAVGAAPGGSPGDGDGSLMALPGTTGH